MNENMVIWGTGRIGTLAYYQYYEKYNIVCYVDSDENKWGKKIHGIPIYSPDFLRGKNVQIVIALRLGIMDVKRRLENDYGIFSYSTFDIKEEFFEKSSFITDDIDENSIIMLFGGGLGNQLFQYALFKTYMLKGKKVYADLLQYKNPNSMKFKLPEVFNIDIKSSSAYKYCECLRKTMGNLEQTKKTLIYVEPTAYEIYCRSADMGLLDISGGIIKGIFQTSVYADSIRDELLQTLKFNCDVEYKLKHIAEEIVQKNMVSIHVRRGDYLEKNNRWIYGNICTDDYYNKAIKYIQERANECEFCLFSDDIEWSRKHFENLHATYIDAKMFDDYQDWYDMYLMSICKHNIIANSTFSWWGAWLNQNTSKIVVAPKKWVNQCEYLDIYPKGWITL